MVAIEVWNRIDTDNRKQHLVTLEKLSALKRSDGMPWRLSQSFSATRGKISQENLTFNIKWIFYAIKAIARNHVVGRRCFTKVMAITKGVTRRTQQASLHIPALCDMVGIMQLSRMSTIYEAAELVR